jgi:poly-beta-hydroxyalkanoate depolymerase
MARWPPSSKPAVPDVRGAEDLDDPYSGVLDAAFHEDLEAYANQEVTLLADVAEVVSPRVFTVTSPDDPEVRPVLVVATEDAEDVDPQAGASLLLAATPVDSFEAEVVVDELALDVQPEQLEEWEEQTFLDAEILRPTP